MTELVQVERQGHVAVICLNDARRRNALSTQLVREAMEALAESRSGAAPARAVVITGQDADFCAGADIRDMLETGWLDGGANASGEPTPPDLFRAIEEDPRPVVAAVHGRVLGGGVELAIACDLVVAAPTTRFMLPEIGLGVLPNTALARLPAIIGARRTAELVLTRRAWDAKEAADFGFVNVIAETETLRTTAVELASAIVASAPPGAIAGVKQALKAPAQDWDQITKILELMVRPEWEEGTRAFTEKRVPDYEALWSGS